MLRVGPSFPGLSISAQLKLLFIYRILKISPVSLSRSFGLSLSLPHRRFNAVVPCFACSSVSFFVQPRTLMVRGYGFAEGSDELAQGTQEGRRGEDKWFECTGVG